jgi:hypothetical protein
MDELSEEMFLSVGCLDVLFVVVDLCPAPCDKSVH